MATDTARPTLKDHLQEHALRYNVKLHDVYHAVLGEQGKGGLCDEVDKIKGDIESNAKVIDKRFETVCENIADIKDSMKWITRLVLGAVVLAVMGVIFVK